MNLNNIPVLGKMNRTVNALIANFTLLGIIFLALGVIIVIYPQVLIYLVSAVLILMAISFLHIAYNIHSHKKRYFEWLEKIK